MFLSLWSSSAVARRSRTGASMTAARRSIRWRWETSRIPMLQREHYHVHIAMERRLPFRLPFPCQAPWTLLLVTDWALIRAALSQTHQLSVGHWYGVHTVNGPWTSSLCERAVQHKREWSIMGSFYNGTPHSRAPHSTIPVTESGTKIKTKRERSTPINGNVSFHQSMLLVLGRGRLPHHPPHTLGRTDHTLVDTISTILVNCFRRLRVRIPDTGGMETTQTTEARSAQPRSNAAGELRRSLQRRP